MIHEPNTKVASYNKHTKFKNTVSEPFNARIKSLLTTLTDEIFLLGILLLEPCISLIYA
jgi:hypothetical protein